VGANLRATQAELANTTLQFSRCQIRVLKRNRRQARKALRVISNDTGNVVV
jgi:hypothetical protein